MGPLLSVGKCSLRNISVLVLLHLLTGVVSAGQYAAPDLGGFKLHDERDADGDGDGVNDPHIKRYLNEAGDSVVSMTTNDRLWAWSLDAYDNESGELNYVIRDSNCDGVFDEVYSLDNEFHVPDCLKQVSP